MTFLLFMDNALPNIKLSRYSWKYMYHVPYVPCSNLLIWDVAVAFWKSFINNTLVNYMNLVNIFIQDGLMKF